MRGGKCADIFWVNFYYPWYLLHLVLTDLVSSRSLFLISLNPYTPLPIYTPQIVASYRNKRREEVAPHIYAIAERAWCQMGEEGECQSVLIT